MGPLWTNWCIKLWWYRTEAFSWAYFNTEVTLQHCERIKCFSDFLLCAKILQYLSMKKNLFFLFWVTWAFSVTYMMHLSQCQTMKVDWGAGSGTELNYGYQTTALICFTAHLACYSINFSVLLSAYLSQILKLIQPTTLSDPYCLRLMTNSKGHSDKPLYLFLKLDLHPFSSHLPRTVSFRSLLTIGLSFFLTVWSH